MPIYEYECLTCGDVFEKRQGFNDEPKADCPQGHADTRRLVVAPAIVFKGSGFYINDSRQADKSKLNGNGQSASTADSKTETKSESKPKTEVL